jgi:hypothetical protein
LCGNVAANSLISLRGNVARMVVACAVSLHVVTVDSLYLNHSTISHLRNIALSMIRARFLAYFKRHANVAHRCAVWRYVARNVARLSQFLDTFAPEFLSSFRSAG